MVTIEERADEKIAIKQQWHDAMSRQVHNVIVGTLEASETMLEEVDSSSEPEELRIELMAAALNAVAAMGGGTKEKFIQTAKEAAEEHLNRDNEDRS